MVSRDPFKGMDFYLPSPMLTTIYLRGTIQGVVRTSRNMDRTGSLMTGQVHYSGQTMGGGSRLALGLIRTVETTTRLCTNPILITPLGDNWRNFTSTLTS
jgi:hypothetical protein